MKALIFLAIGTSLLFACNNKPAESTEPAKDTAMAVKETKPAAAYEIGNMKYVDVGKKMLQQLASGDVDSWGDNFADNAVFQWSSLDSLAGKKAILDYWKNRRMKVIDSLQESEDVWIPMKVNTPQSRGDVPGDWLLSWYITNVKYKNGKRLVFLVHQLFHFNADGKIDRTIFFLDRGPINKALGVK
jgi:ketosteroid isomerase-like protein